MKLTNFLLKRLSKETFIKFLYFFIKKMQKEHIHLSAGYLSYVTLMSLVPLMVVMLSIITAFPIFSDITLVIENFVYANFLPASGDIVKEHIAGFVENASQMSTIAISFLFLFALLLISSIDKTLNHIWKVTRKRRVFTAFSIYWMILTLGPILMGSSIAATSYLVSLMSLESYDVFGFSAFFMSVLPIFASASAFLILYMVVPNKAVTFKYAISGALLAALLFEFAKKGFALCKAVTSPPTTITMVPAAAPAGPPLTGLSKSWWP